MILRPAATRGYLNAGWIESRRTFSNNSYWDLRYQGWGNLKVINDDIQQPGNMVPNHPHRNYDILGYMVAGELEHTDSLGNTSRAVPGQVQHMWCGREIRHTEASVGTVPARYLQLWITPKDEYKDTDPFYEIIEKSPEFGPIAVDLKQTMTIHAGWIRRKTTLNTSRAYLYVVQGQIQGADFTLNEGDGAELYADFTADFNAHILLFQEQYRF